MSPIAARRRKKATRATSSRRPLASTNNTAYDQEQITSDLKNIFINSQHVTSTNQALEQMKKLYSNSNFNLLEKPFIICLKRLLQSNQSIYFKTSCDFICKFLQYVTTSLNDDRMVRTCADVADHYMQIAHEDSRLNAVYFTSKFLAHLETLDEEICNAWKVTLPKRIRDKKPAIRTQAILASRKFQDNKLIKEGFKFHFYRDPELSVRKALLQTMDIEIFGCEFLADATQDSHEAIRKVAFQRLSKVSPKDLTKDQLHQIIHNGLFERERHVSFSFKLNTLGPWLAKMYDGLDMTKLVGFFDVIKHEDGVGKLLTLVHEIDLEKIENNGTATKLHHVVEAFRETWLSSGNKCLPSLDSFNERVVTVWLSLVSFCKKNRSVIKPVKVRIIQPPTNNHDESIERLLESQDQNNEEVAELYERLTPDLVNLVDFLKRFVVHTEQVISEGRSSAVKCEFTYHKLMGFISTYEIGDESERKTVQEALGSILRDNLLTGHFNQFIPPIVKCLHKLIYSTSSNLMINYISELIQNIRSHLEDLDTSIDDGRASVEPRDDPSIFRYHPNELIKCLQMYYSCLESVRISEVPPTMCNHLSHLSYESLNEWFKSNTRVRSLMVACNGLTALMDKSFAQLDRTNALFISACYDTTNSLEIKTIGFKCLVDVVIEHDDLQPPSDRLERFINNILKDYGKYDPAEIEKDELDFVTAILYGTAKLLYHKKLASPELLAHIIVWWYHPRTDSRLTQFIGVFLPMFVRDASAKRVSNEDKWLEELLAEAFVVSIEYLHEYILGPGYNIMAEGDMLNLISFLCNLVPVSIHPRVHEVVDKRIDDLGTSDTDLIKFMRRSKQSLAS